MTQELRLQQNNKGLSLVELIVTILISSVVMLAVVGLLTTGLDLYKHVSAETTLQTEGQAAIGRINELVQEAKYLKFYSNEGEDSGASTIEELGNNKVLVLATQEDAPLGWWYYIAWDSEGKMLLLMKETVTMKGDGTIDIPSATDITGAVTTMTTATQKKKYLLAQYIGKFNFREIDNKLYYLDILLENDNKQFSTSQFINERNQ